MTDNRRNNHFVIFALILIMGLGLALALPWLANSQGLAAQSEVLAQDNSPTATRYYVAITGTGTTGASWATAFKNVQDALGVVSAGDEIWVAEGIYYPDVSSSGDSNARGDTFELEDEVALYGGFIFNETNFNARDPLNNITILSGDIRQDDDTDANGIVTSTAGLNNNNNSFHVVGADGVTVTTVLDGFTITAGQANESDNDANGGGFYCDGSGSGKECNPSLSHVTFSGNYAGEIGGAMFNDGELGGGSNPNLKNVTFSGNSADSYGGAIYNNGYQGESSPSLINVTFSGNYSGFNGGAMYNDGYEGTSDPSLINVSFSGNSANNHGGAMYNEGNSGESSPSLTNVTLSGNSAGGSGGAIYSDGLSGGTSSPDVRNSIFWNNQASNFTDTISATIYNKSSATITLTYSLVQDSLPGGSWIGGSYVDGGGNIDEDPLFIEPISPTTAPTITGNLRLTKDSPAIDAGDNIFIPPDVLTDLDGEPREVDGNLDGTPTVDMGAYEYQIEYLYDGYLPIIFR